MSELKLAQAPTTPPTVLAALAKKSERLAKLAAKNPNLSKELLFRLGSKHPKEFLQNPALSMLLLEDPLLWARLSPGLLLALLRTKGAPIQAISAALSRSEQPLSTKLELCLAAHPETHVELLLRLAGSYNDTVRRLAAKHPMLPPAIAKLAGSELWSHQGREHLVTRKPPLLDNDIVRLTPAEYSFAAQHGGLLCRRLAKLAGTPPDTLQRLVHGESRYTSLDACQNPSTPAEALRVMLERPSCLERIANNHGATPELLSLLWRKLDGNTSQEAIRRELAQNPNTPADILLALVEKNLGLAPRQLWILHSIAKNPSLPPEKLREIYHQVPTTQSAIIENESCPLDLLLAHDSPYDQIKNPRLPEALALSLMKQNPHLAKSFIEKKRRATLSREMLDWLSQHEAREIRCLIAGHPDLPEEALLALSRDKSYLVRAAVAERKRLPMQVRKRLRRDKSVLVRALSNTTS